MPYGEYDVRARVLTKVLAFPFRDAVWGRRNYRVNLLGHGLLHERSLFSERLMAHPLARNAWIEEDLVDQLFNSSEN